MFPEKVCNTILYTYNIRGVITAVAVVKEAFIQPFTNFVSGSELTLIFDPLNRTVNGVTLKYASSMPSTPMPTALMAVSKHSGPHLKTSI